jgi:ATP-dependent Clp protease ATP-binding subunit ClpB
MNLQNFTIKATEAIQQAQQIAFNQKNPTIETEHFLQALLKLKIFSFLEHSLDCNL